MMYSKVNVDRSQEPCCLCVAFPTHYLMTSQDGLSRARTIARATLVRLDRSQDLVRLCSSKRRRGN